ncbi:pimeloyl-ACP methyl ester esterase BioH [Ferrimonas senticii]|uniref:pimeloyl-ACP methyl ester esterase BioH n=1 Tax=Ferrimonas senticii TaxID=394566 RepID=UPI000413898F|nr:pimeloyl-ACP methyl ester esterase BioH [Ferrimonas senticii]
MSIAPVTDLKPTLVLLHGWGMNCAVWQQLTPQLQALGFAVVTPNLPGFGGAKTLSDPTDLSLMAAHLWQQLPARCHLLGWSLGGLLALQMSLQAPQRVASLVTIASSPAFQAADNWPGITPAVLANFAAQLANDSDKTIAAFLALQGMGSASNRADIRLLKQAMLSQPSADATALAGGLTILTQVDLRSQLSQITPPWMRLYGRNDALVPKASIGVVDRLAPHSRSHIFAPAGHAPFISHPDLVLEVLSDFYASAG